MGYLVLSWEGHTAETCQQVSDELLRSIQNRLVVGFARVQVPLVRVQHSPHTLATAPVVLPSITNAIGDSTANLNLDTDADLAETTLPLTLEDLDAPLESSVLPQRLVLRLKGLNGSR